MRAGAVFAVALMSLPLLFAFYASVSPERRLFDSSEFLSKSFVWDHYAALFRTHHFQVAIKNSLVVSASTTALSVVLGALSAYALARLRFPGKRLVLAGILAVSMFPQVSIVSPLYLFLRAVRLIDTYPGLVLPYLTFAMPLSVWLLVGFFRKLPEEIEHAALIDGASRLRVFFEITLPLSVPSLVTTGIITFIFCWNEFLFALAFTVTEERHTVPVAVSLFRGQHQVPWGEIFAASIVASLPVFALVLLFQKRIVEGLTAGAVKG